MSKSIYKDIRLGESHEPKRYQCRHIFTDGRRCGSTSLRGEEFCYYHHSTRKPAADPKDRKGRLGEFTLPMPEDRSAIQSALGLIIQRVASNDLDPRRAGLLLYALQIASLNLPRQPEEQEPTVDRIEIDPELGPLAPTCEVLRPTNFSIKEWEWRHAQRCLTDLEAEVRKYREQEQDRRREALRQQEEQEKQQAQAARMQEALRKQQTSAPPPSPTQAPQHQESKPAPNVLPNLQAVADPATKRVPHRSHREGWERRIHLCPQDGCPIFGAASSRLRWALPGCTDAPLMHRATGGQQPENSDGAKRHPVVAHLEVLKGHDSDFRREHGPSGP